jgi:hypothetical protein
MKSERDTITDATAKAVSLRAEESVTSAIAKALANIPTPGSPGRQHKRTKNTTASVNDMTDGDEAK